MTPTEKKTHTDKLEEYQMNSQEAWENIAWLILLGAVVILIKFITL